MSPLTAGQYVRRNLANDGFDGVDPPAAAGDVSNLLSTTSTINANTVRLVPVRLAIADGGGRLIVDGRLVVE